jgi:hypothetical protein
MAIGKLFKSLFGGESTPSKPKELQCDPFEYNGFKIEPAPIIEDGKFRTAGYISGELEGVTKRIQFIRADQSGDQQLAIDHSRSKAKQIIDEQGQKLLVREQL